MEPVYGWGPVQLAAAAAACAFAAPAVHTDTHKLDGTSSTTGWFIDRAGSKDSSSQYVMVKMPAMPWSGCATILQQTKAVAEPIIHHVMNCMPKPSQ